MIEELIEAIAKGKAWASEYTKYANILPDEDNNQNVILARDLGGIDYFPQANNWTKKAVQIVIRRELTSDSYEKAEQHAEEIKEQLVHSTTNSISTIEIDQPPSNQPEVGDNRPRVVMQVHVSYTHPTTIN